MSGKRYSFGTFELIPKQRLLLSSGKPVALGTRALDLLIMLAERNGDVVSKKDLLDHVWPNIVVDEAALRVHLSALRKVLRDGASGESLIANIQGRGYCLTAPVRSGIVVDENVSSQSPHRYHAHNLPISGKRIIGREDVVADLMQKLGQTRFLSIVGAGGIGKTSVALQLAERASARYVDGTIIVDLATLSDPALLCGAISNASGLAVNTENLLPGLIAYFSGKHALLILDNCEHLVDAAASVAEQLWRAVPCMNILATSREPLRAEGEWVYRLAPLDYPLASGTISVEEARSFPAIELLVERASASDSGFVLGDEDVPAVIELCRRLDGIPLALELAAAAVGPFGLQGLANQFDTRFLIVMKGRRTALHRHQTLGATLDWSYELLSARDRILLARLAVFPGNMDLSAVLAVVTDEIIPAEEVLEGIYNLHEKSLLFADLGSDNIDYRLLETTRVYALEKLQSSGERAFFARRHAEYFCCCFENAESDWDVQSQREWLSFYGRRLVDLRAALTWGFSEGGDVEIGVRLLAFSTPLWAELALSQEYLGRLEVALERIESTPLSDPLLEARLRIALVQTIWIARGPDARMIEMAREALALAENCDAILQQIQALWGLWNVRNISGDASGLPDVTEQIRRISESSSQPIIQMAGLRIMVLTNHYVGDQARAWSYHERMTPFPDVTFHQFGKIGYWLNQKLVYMTMSVRLLWLRGYQDQAMQAARDGIEYARRINRPTNLAYFLGFAACPVALWCGDVLSAGEFVSMLKDVSSRHSLTVWHSMAGVYEQATACLGKRPDISRTCARALDAESQFSFHQLELFSTLHEDFVASSILRRCETEDTGWCLSEALRAKAVLSTDATETERLMVRSLGIARRQDARSWELRAATSLARLLKSQGRAAEARSILDGVYSQFTEGFEAGDLIAAKALLADLGAETLAQYSGGQLGALDRDINIVDHERRGT